MVLITIVNQETHFGTSFPIQESRNNKRTERFTFSDKRTKKKLIWLTKEKRTFPLVLWFKKWTEKHYLYLLVLIISETRIKKHKFSFCFFANLCPGANRKPLCMNIIHCLPFFNSCVKSGITKTVSWGIFSLTQSWFFCSKVNLIILFEFAIENYKDGFLRFVTENVTWSNRDRTSSC